MLRDIVRDILQKYELNQSQLSTKLGISRSYISHVMSHSKHFSPEMHRKLAKAFPEFADRLENSIVTMPNSAKMRVIFENLKPQQIENVGYELVHQGFSGHLRLLSKHVKD